MFLGVFWAPSGNLHPVGRNAAILACGAHCRQKDEVSYPQPLNRLSTKLRKTSTKGCITL
jgi:hypothetical protein